MNQRKSIILLCLSALILTACESQPNANDESDKKHQASLNVAQVLVSAGEFIRGSNRQDDVEMRRQYGFPQPLYIDENPQRKISLDAFKIDTYEVTNKQYKTYIMQSRAMLPFAWMSNGYVIAQEQLEMLDVEKLRKMASDVFRLDIDTRTMGKDSLIIAMLEQQTAQDNFPMVNVNWFSAKEFCQWRNGRLPTEAEWEKAARGTEGFEFPWGNKWDPKITNTGDDGEWDEGMAPVGSYPNNQSPYGAYDMAGNVWEWVADWYQPYEGGDTQAKAFGKKNRVLRGGGGGVGHYALSYFFRTATRQFSEPEMESEDVGFRCVTDV